jgi:hypothetical protein
MDLKQYIKFRLEKAFNKSEIEQREILFDIYKEMEKRGYKHLKIYNTINEVLLDNVKDIIEKFKGEEQ